jgi:hypothetical protein
MDSSISSGSGATYLLSYVVTLCSLAVFSNVSEQPAISISYIFTLKMGAASFSEMFIPTYQTTQHHIPGTVNFMASKMRTSNPTTIIMFSL